MQPIHRNTIDPFKIYIQVKATSGPVKKGRTARAFIRPMKLAHIRKWVRSPELVVVVFWFEQLNKAYFAIPAHQYTEWALFQKKGRLRSLGYIVR